ncbi:Metallo-dependent phosphatase [Exidia glandulosa HHB12029]|uniref:Metallo-dependent phosphatase n=1 Tax=Exidia glandulosa HHB12029 TaxID=1314781 RepID=A0A165HSW0_EXIGL|nr:Metallo-dependent phosphatase [Exidia glandulosa HHB12029]
MGLSDQVARPLRSGVAPITTVILFSILLAYVFVLYQPGVGPGAIQRLGWQAWEVINPTPTVPQHLDDLGLPANEPKPSGTPTHWWEAPASTPTDPAAPSTFPLDKWLPLLSRTTGLSEITISRCMFPPFMSSVCAPKQRYDEEFRKGGEWVRVDRDINAKSGYWYLNMYYRRTRRFDVPLITNITLLPQGGEAALQDRASWKQVSTSVRDGVPGLSPLYLWYKLGPTLQDYKDENATQKIITELDVLYGDGPAWWSFDKVPTAVTPGKGNAEPVWITYRRGPGKALPTVPPLHFNPERNGTYKILQVADLHFSVSHGQCREVTTSPCTNADDMTAELLSRTLDAEKPDLVIFTGDQLNGQKTSWDSKSVLAKFAREVIRRRIPWAAILGNHDDEEDMDRKELVTHLAQMPYSVTQVGPQDIEGAGNYLLKIRSGDPSATHILTLYFLDSGGYIKANFGPFTQITDYDYIRQRQIDWFLQQSASIKPVLRPFHPDGAADLGHISARAKKPVPEAAPAQTLAKPNALMFYHIPIPETSNAPDLDASGKPLDVGSQFEEAGGSKKNAGFFEKALLSTFESARGPPEVKVVGNGHHHVTDNCRRVKGIWFCFGGGGSYAGYGRLGFDRRFRVYEISDYGETIRTYKRTEFDKIIDDVVLVGRGALGA